jgi:hypothetical protein
MQCTEAEQKVIKGTKHSLFSESLLKRLFSLLFISLKTPSAHAEYCPIVVLN